ncbi:MAG: 4-hydroxy-3-methylbut-2-enyl diphosphate reductase [Pseudomonadota bacterium]
MTAVLAAPRGFCAGVERAVETVERALAQHGAPVYVRHEIVHNARVCAALTAKGAVFVEELDEVPPRSVVVFSAHGVARTVEEEAAAAGHRVIDATCPLVTRVHINGRRYAAEGRTVILIGHLGHAEVEGTLGQIDVPVHVVATAEEVAALDLPHDAPVAYITQTTLSVADTRGVIEAIAARWPDSVGPDTRDICYATQNRQQAVSEIAAEVDAVLIVGAPNSSNSNRLVEIAEAAGRPARLVPAAEDLDLGFLAGVARVGISAGASAPEVIVQELLQRLGTAFALTVEQRAGVREDVTFRLPRSLERGAQGRNTNSAGDQSTPRHRIAV